jgi:uncharacterized membrane protein
MESSLAHQQKRFLPLDALRGLVMILMAIDHANFFVARMHPTGEFWGVSLPQYDNIAEFLTRFVTHMCAPGFFFLLGVGMTLFAHSRRSLGWRENKISTHLLLRGLILVCCQFFLVNSAWIMGPIYALRPPGAGETVWIYFGVLASLGATMVIATLFLRLKPPILLGLSSIIVIGNQFLVPDASQAGHPFSPLIRILYIPGRTGIFQSFYPILPWLGIVLFGFVFGKWLLKDRTQAYRKALLLGGIFIILFFFIRILGDFGNIHPPESFGFISLFNVTKYPPSLVFTFLTMGLCLTFLGLFSLMPAFLDNKKNPLLVFGQSALFFYVLHLYLFALIGLFFASRGGSGLAIMYPVWVLGLLILFPLCLLYGRFKRRKPADSIWRFF